MAKYQCNGCSYIFDEALGEKHEGYPPMPFASLPDDFTCPQCSVRYKEDFERIEAQEPVSP